MSTHLSRIPVRHMNFGFAKQAFTKDHVGDNPLITSIFCNLSAAIPEGERFFVRAVRHFRDRIDDPLLRQHISGFIGQEAFHAREHDQLNATLAQAGFPMEQHEALFLYAIKLLQQLPPKAQLAATAALEHYTAIIAEGLLRDERLRAMLPPVLRDFWMWHAIEESEHKAVAFDVYQQISGSYTLRAGIMLGVSAIYWPLVLTLVFKQVIEAGDLTRVGKIAQGLNLAFGLNGFFSRLTLKYLDYLKPSFHPNDHDCEQVLADWKAQLLDGNGRLDTYLKPAA